MIWVLAGLVALVAGVFLAPLIAEARRYPMDNKARALAPGQFADLSAGLTQYQWHGPSHGPIVVCVHGLTTPGFVWLPVVAGLTLLGCRVLTYDLYGRGYSDRPAGRQDAAFLVRQLNELMAQADAGADLTLIGYSMGGGIAAAYAVRHPEGINRLVLIAPTGLDYRPSRLQRLARDLPVLGEAGLLCLGGREIARATRVPQPPVPALPGLAARQIEETVRQGCFPAILSCLRYFLNQVRDADHAALAQSGLPVLAIWGEFDKTIPLTALGKLTQINRTARHFVVPGAGHGLPMTHARAVLAAVQAMIRDGA